MALAAGMILAGSGWIAAEYCCRIDARYCVANPRRPAKRQASSRHSPSLCFVYTCRRLIDLSLIAEMAPGQPASAEEEPLFLSEVPPLVRFQYKNPDFLLRNLDFLFKNVDCKMKRSSSSSSGSSSGGSDASIEERRQLLPRLIGGDFVLQYKCHLLFEF